MAVTKSHFNIVKQIETSPEHVLVLVGTALGGPSRQPFEIQTDADPYEILGNCPLTKAYKASVDAGSMRTVIYRINGTHSTAVIKYVAGNKEVIRLTSVCGSEEYNDIQVTAYSTHLYTVDTKGNAKTYFFSDYQRAEDLVYAINRDAHYGLIEFTAESIDGMFDMTQLTTDRIDYAFTGGNVESHLIPNRVDGVDMELLMSYLKPELAKALFGHDELDQLERQPNGPLGLMNFGVITLVDMFINDDSELAEMLGSFCLYKTKHMDMGCIGVIGTKPLLDTSSYDTIHSYAHELETLSKNKSDIEAYQYINVVVGECYYDQEDVVPTSLAYAFAATEALLPYYTILSNKKINGITTLNYELTKEDIDLLSANGYTCIVPSIRRGHVPYLSTTHVKDQSLLTAKPNVVRISQMVTRLINSKLELLVGTRSGRVSRKEINDQLKLIMDGLIVRNVIKKYSVDCEFKNRNRDLNVSIQITPFSEVKSILTATSVTFPEGVIR